MPDKKKTVVAHVPGSGHVSTQPLKPQSDEEARVWEILDRARQETKAKRMEQLEAEVIGADILNLRLKSQH